MWKQELKSQFVYKIWSTYIPFSEIYSGSQNLKISMWPWPLWGVIYHLMASSCKTPSDGWKEFRTGRRWLFVRSCRLSSPPIRSVIFQSCRFTAPPPCTRIILSLYIVDGKKCDRSYTIPYYHRGAHASSAPLRNNVSVTVSMSIRSC